jgi:hypothetical protein
MLIAEVARKQALRALAEALEAEARSGALAVRSLRLVAATAPEVSLTSGEAFAARAGFTAGLAQLSAQAEAAARDAALQRAWQAEALARAETRAKRVTEMAAEARTALAAARSRREVARDLPLARKLQTRLAD